MSDTTKQFLSGIDDLIKGHMPNVSFGAYAGYVECVDCCPPLYALSSISTASPLLGDDAQKQYYGTNVPKLEAIKAAVDPTEVFWNPQSIKPAKAGVTPEGPSSSPSQAVRNTSYFTFDISYVLWTLWNIYLSV